MNKLVIAAALCLIAAHALAAEVVVRKAVSAPLVPGHGLPNAEVVKNAPVHARLTTRSERSLCDGNRIVNEQVETLYRDSAGRERREIQEGDGQVVFIQDGGRNLMLDAGHNLAVPLPPLPPMAVPHGVMAAPVVEIDVDVDEPKPPAGEDVRVVRKIVNVTSVGDAPSVAVPAVPMLDFVELFDGSEGVGQSSVEPLGQKKIDGIRVEGTRHTTVFAAGSLGNEKPIEVVKTTWYSPELRMMVRSEEYDPRSGTVTYTAEILSRKEPDGALFDVPEGYHGSAREEF